MSVRTEGFIEELATYLEANKSLSSSSGADVPLRKGTTLTISNIVDVSSETLEQPVLCTLFEEGSEISEGSRLVRQRRTVRFVLKARVAQHAVNYARQLQDWFVTKRRFLLTGFVVLQVQVGQDASLSVVRQDGTYLADMSLEFLVINR